MLTVDEFRDKVIAMGVDEAIYDQPVDDLKDDRLRSLVAQAVGAQIDYVEALQEVESYLYDR